MPPLTPVVKGLLFANIALFVVVMIIGEASPVAQSLEMYAPWNDNFRVWQVVTHGFMHGGLMHIFFNMLVLFFLGPMVEGRVGSQRFLTLYFVAMLGGVLFHFGLGTFTNWRLEQALEAFQANPSLSTFTEFFSGLDLSSSVYETYNGVNEVVRRENAERLMGELQNRIALGEQLKRTYAEAEVLMQEIIVYNNGGKIVGASGAIAGVAGAFAVLFPHYRLTLFPFPIGARAAIFIYLYVVGSIVLHFLDLPGDPIAHLAHVGGAVFGALLGYFFGKSTTPPHIRRWN